MSQSTMIQTCQAPGGSLDYLKEWGVVSYDWSNNAAVWHADHPNDCDVKMVEQAAKAKAAAPNTQVWIYRNLVQAYAEFVQVREKLEDPAYAGWFMKFGPNNNETSTPRCSENSRNETHCSDLFHWKGQRPGGDCGDIIPCGWYVFDHRNESLRSWIVEEFILGDKLGLGNESVDGFLFDDWWTLDGPTETNGFFGGTNLPHNGTEIAEIRGNWSITVWESQKRIAEQKGYTWSNVNCNLDYHSGYGGSPEDFALCGLVKTEGYFHADNVKGTPVKEKEVTAAKGQCAAWLSAACTPTSVLPEIPILMSFTRNDDGKQFPLPAPLQDIATFLLVRGAYAWMGYGWLGCTDTYERPDALKHDYGEPVDKICYETTPGVFTRKWSKATITLDCNTWTPNITLSGSDAPLAL